MTAYLVIGGAFFLAIILGLSIGNTIADAFNVSDD